MIVFMVASVISFLSFGIGGYAAYHAFCRNKTNVSTASTTPSMYAIGSLHWNGLSKLLEEMGELSQVGGKLMGSEGSVEHWSGNLDDKFIEELGDVYAALDFFVEKNFRTMQKDAIEQQRKLKLARFHSWNNEVISNG